MNTLGALDTPTPVVRQRPITVDEYHRMAEVGILDEEDRVELLDGCLLTMHAIGPLHLHCVNRLVDRLATRLYSQTPRPATMSIQNPLRLSSTSEPEPDVVLLDPDTPQDRVPTPADACLVVEVGNSSAGYDRSVKAPQYAKAGVSTYWIVDLGARAIDVLSDPEGAMYAQHKRYRRGEAVPLPESLTADPLSVDAIVGPAAAD